MRTEQLIRIEYYRAKTQQERVSLCFELAAMLYTNGARNPEERKGEKA